MADPLDDVLVRHGASMRSFHDLSLPADFGDPRQEWRAGRESCAVFDARFRSFVHATGADRVNFLQGMLSNDLKKLATGEGRHAAFLTQQARLVSDLRVYADTDALVLDVLAWRRDTLVEGLQRFLVADDVELIDSESEIPLFGLEGPSAPMLAERVFGTAMDDAAPYDHQRIELEGHAVRVVRVSEVGGGGLLLSGPKTLAAPLFERLCSEGATPIGLDALNVLRVESGVPWAGIDMDEEVLLMEVGLGDAVSFTKGCYLGQEVVERVSARGHVNRKLTGLRLDGGSAPETGSKVFADDTEIGWTVSSAISFALERPIALAYVRRELLDAGTGVHVATPGGREKATVQPLPFV